MASPDPFAAKLLESSASAYSAWTVNALLRSRPQVAERFGDGAFLIWEAHVTQRILELAAALAVGEPRLFSSRVTWARAAFRARQVPDEDLQTSLETLRAVLAERLPPAAAETTSRFLDLALRTFDEPVVTESRSLDPQGQELALRYLLAILEGDPRRAIREVVTAVDGGLSLADAYLQVLLPAQREIGRMWHAGEVGVAEEHLATATTRRAMAVLCQRGKSAPANGKTVLTAAVPGDAHDIGVQAAADLFELAGWRALCLGADIPAEELAMSVRTFRIDLLVLSATLSTHLNRLRETVALVRASCGDQLPILVGGGVLTEAPDLATQLGASACATSLADVLAVAARLVGLPAGEAAGSS